MTDNFETLETPQLELMHQQTHDKVDGGEDCLTFRSQHDSLAAELIKRGISHSTPIVCAEPVTSAPNYERGFTDNLCVNCAFGQLFPSCNLYNFEYIKDFVCDSFRYFEVLELEPPHGFLMTNGKQTALASIEKRDTDKATLIISNGEAFGIAEFDQPAQLGIKDFDSDEWQKQHRITRRERRQWWPDATAFYVYPLKSWLPYDGIKLFEDGRVIDEPKLSAKQWQVVSKSKDLPKQIFLDNAVSITNRNEFIISPEADSTNLRNILSATYETEIKTALDATETIPIYSLVLVRNPRMRVSKKNTIKAEKQEGEPVPYSIVRNDDGEFCVINTETENVEGCHDTEDEAEVQRTALRINVEEDEAAAHLKPRKPKKKKPRHPKKKEAELILETDGNVSLGYELPLVDNKQIDETDKTRPKEKKSFRESLLEMYKSIAEFLNITNSDEAEEDNKLFPTDAGVTQKLVKGELWHFTWSTNAFEDRDGEIFSTKSLENYVAANEKKEDRGYFNFWHINEEDGNFNSDFAVKKWQGVVGRFLIEAGPYLRNEKGRRARKFFKKYYAGHPKIAPEGWGCSPEYKFLPEERETGVYENIWITRTSTLPRMAAANIWTDTRQVKRGTKMALTEQQRAAADELFDKEYVIELVREALNKTAELEKVVAHKGATETEVEAETAEGGMVVQTSEESDLVVHTAEAEAVPEATQDAEAETEEKQPAPIVQPAEVTMTQDQFNTLAEAVAGKFQINNESIVEAINIVAQSLTTMGERVAELESKGNARAKAETATFTFEMQRATEDKETIVTDDDDLKDKKPVEARAPAGSSTPESFFATS